MQYCNKILNEHIRKAVRRYRKSHQLRQNQMAELLRISPRAYNYYENNDGGFSSLSFASFLFLLLDTKKSENRDITVTDAAENEELLALLRNLRRSVEEAEKTSE